MSSSRLPQLVLIVISVSVFSYFCFDLPFAIWLSQHASLRLIGFAELMSYWGKFPICLVFALAACLFLEKNKQRDWKSYVYIFLCFFVTSCICWTLKVFLGRYRPDAYFSDHLYGFTFKASDDHAQHSMPSGHASVVATLMTSLALMAPKHAVWFYSLSVILSFARVVLRAHYLSDVLLSWLVGVLVAVYLEVLSRKVWVNQALGSILKSFRLK